MWSEGKPNGKSYSKYLPGKCGAYRSHYGTEILSVRGAAVKAVGGNADAEGISVMVQPLLVLLLPSLNGVRSDLGDEPVAPGQQRQSLQDNNEAQGGLGYGVEALVQLDEGHAFVLCCHGPRCHGCHKIRQRDENDSLDQKSNT